MKPQPATETRPLAIASGDTERQCSCPRRCESALRGLPPIALQPVEPTDALRSIETALRLAVRDVLGEAAWLSARGAPDEVRLEERRIEEGKRRDGAFVSNRLLDYTETYHLTALVLSNWQQFQPVFRDRVRTEAYFGVVEDVRNSVAHSRDLVPFERDLISGIAGQLRNQISLFRSGADSSSKYYPLIESVKDSFGTEGSYTSMPISRGPRVEVDDVLTFTGAAFGAKGRAVSWRLLRTKGQWPSLPQDHTALEVGEGDSVTFSYQITEADVDESFTIIIQITTNFRYHRHTLSYRHPFDDERFFLFAVNPPDES